MIHFKPSASPHDFSPRRQKGTILITVVLIAAVVIVMVIESVKSVRYQKQLSSNLINRDQAYSYLMGMEELAKIWLQKAFEKEKEETVHLNQPWAQDDITFPLDGGGMTASIIDMQSCFNLNSIATTDDNSKNSGNRDNDQNNTPVIKPDEDGFAGETTGQIILEELFSQTSRGGDSNGKALAVAVRDWIDEDIDSAGPDGAEDDYYQSLEIPYRTANALIAHTSELLAIKGFNAKVYGQVLPNICVLPDKNVIEININTVPPESAVLIYATLGGKIPMTDVSNALNARGEKGFESVEEFLTELGGSKGNVNSASQARLSVTSHYFQMTAQAEIGKTRVAMKTLFKKNDDNTFKVISRYFGKE